MGGGRELLSKKTRQVHIMRDGGIIIIPWQVWLTVLGLRDERAWRLDSLDLGNELSGRQRLWLHQFLEAW